MRNFDHLKIRLPDLISSQLGKKSIVQVEDYLYASKDGYIVQACSMLIPINNSAYSFEIRAWVKVDIEELYKIRNSNESTDLFKGILLGEIAKVECLSNDIVEVELQYLLEDGPSTFPKIVGSRKCVELDKKIKEGMKEENLISWLDEISQ